MRACQVGLDGGDALLASELGEVEPLHLRIVRRKVVSKFQLIIGTAIERVGAVQTSQPEISANLLGIDLDRLEIRLLSLGHLGPPEMNVTHDCQQSRRVGLRRQSAAGRFPRLVDFLLVQQALDQSHLGMQQVRIAIQHGAVTGLSCRRSGRHGIGRRPRPTGRIRRQEDVAEMAAAPGRTP